MIDAIAANLRRYLDENNVTALALGKRAGTGTTAVYDILNGKSKNPGILTLLKLSNAMGKSLPEFIVGEDAEAFAHRLSQRAAAAPPEDIARLEAMLTAFLAANSEAQEQK